MAGPAALCLQDLRVCYGPVTAVDSVSFDVQRGEIVGLLGPNGSGKSSTLAAAAGVIDPASGSVIVEGFSKPTHACEFARRIGFVPQDHALYDELTAHENLAFFGRMYGFARADLRSRIQRVLASMDLADRAGDRVGTFSGGMKQRLNLAASLLHDPVLLLLDEPTAALDPASRDSLFARLTRLRDEGHAILLTTHHLDEAEQSCDRIVLLDRGRLVAQGKPGDLLHRRSEGNTALVAQLREAMPKFLERAIRQRLGPRTHLELSGRRLRLAAESSEELGHALAFLLAAGIELHSFRTPAGTLERVMRTPIKQGEPCAVGSR